MVVAQGHALQDAQRKLVRAPSHNRSNRTAPARKGCGNAKAQQHLREPAAVPVRVQAMTGPWSVLICVSPKPATIGNMSGERPGRSPRGWRAVCVVAEARAFQHVKLYESFSTPATSTQCDHISWASGRATATGRSGTAPTARTFNSMGVRAGVLKGSGPEGAAT